MTSAPAWIANRPRRWRAVPFRYLYRRTKRVGYENETLLSVYRDHGVVDKSSRSDNFNNASEDLGLYQLVDIGDLAINKMKAWQGSVAVSPIRGIVSPAYFVYTPTHHEHSGFLHYLLRSAEYVRLYQLYSKGIRVNQWDLDPSVHGSMPVLLPPVEEQRRIAEFLDRETAQIDALIAKQEQLISTLAERQAEEAALLLTQGVDPVGLDQETDMWWAPRLPNHWAAVPVRYLARIRTGSGDTQDAKPEGRFPFYVRSMTVERSDRWEFEGPAVLTSGDGAGVGKVFHLARGQFSAHQRVYVMDQFRRVSPEYFYFYFSTFFGRVVLAGTAKSTVESLRRPMVGGLKVTIPSESEQAAIVQALEQRANSYDLLTRKSRAIVEILQERRQALISAAVTGQIDVGGAS